MFPRIPVENNHLIGFELSGTKLLRLLHNLLSHTMTDILGKFSVMGRSRAYCFLFKAFVGIKK